MSLTRSHKELGEINEVLHSVLNWNSLCSAEREPRGPGCWLCCVVFCCCFFGVVLFFEKLGREKFPSNKKLICDFIIQLS